MASDHVSELDDKKECLVLSERVRSLNQYITMTLFEKSKNRNKVENPDCSLGLLHQTMMIFHDGSSSSLPNRWSTKKWTFAACRDIELTTLTLFMHSSICFFPFYSTSVHLFSLTLTTSLNGRLHPALSQAMR